MGGTSHGYLSWNTCAAARAPASGRLLSLGSAPESSDLQQLLEQIAGRYVIRTYRRPDPAMSRTARSMEVRHNGGCPAWSGGSQYDKMSLMI
jgi:hypothetical protein